MNKKHSSNEKREHAKAVLTLEELTTRIVFVAWVNTDLTEGRGAQIPLCICESKATAIRLGRAKDAQGTNASITKEIAIHINGKWHAPARIVSPSSKDCEKRFLSGEKFLDQRFNSSL